MSTGLIIAIIIVALLLIALFAFVLPRARRQAQVRARERELGQRRERAADEHREEAETRRRDAEMAEHKAQMAQAEAQRERAEANLREQRAQLHERGMADDELIGDDERDKFAGTSAMGDRDEPAPMREEDRPMHDPGTTTTGRDGTNTEYEQGREDEASLREGRFGRDDATAQTDEPSTTRRD
jgi:FtsZ-interacting cell division protein ZipA